MTIFIQVNCTNYIRIIIFVFVLTIFELCNDFICERRNTTCIDPLSSLFGSVTRLSPCSLDFTCLTPPSRSHSPFPSIFGFHLLLSSLSISLPSPLPPWISLASLLPLDIARLSPPNMNTNQLYQLYP